VNDYSPQFDKNRSVRIDSLFFNEDGSIRKINPTLRGVGLTKASHRIQIDRYSKISNTGASVEFIDSLNVFEGWKTVLNSRGAWIQYNDVDFENNKFKSLVIRVLSNKGGTLQIRSTNTEGPVIAQVDIPEGNEWKTIKTPLSKFECGIQNLVMLLIDNAQIEVDWISFE
jgi:hypothetical protein